MASSAFAQNRISTDLSLTPAAMTCVNNGNASDARFITAFEADTTAPVLAFRQSEAINGQRQSVGRILAAAGSAIPPGIESLRHLDQVMRFSCFQTSLRRSNSVGGSLCNGSRSLGPLPGPGTGAPCIDQNLARYIHFAFHQALDCTQGIVSRLSGGAARVNSELLFRKINNETGFSFWVHSRSGTGIGQFIDVAVVDALERGRDLLERVITSPDPSCAMFAPLLRQDLERRLFYRLQGRSNFTQNGGTEGIGGSEAFFPSQNRCLWVSPGEGVARSFIYSAIKFQSDRRILFGNFDRQGTSAQTRLARDYVALVAYGPQGIGAAGQLTRVASAQEVINRNSYARRTEASYANYIATPLGLQVSDPSAPSGCFESRQRLASGLNLEPAPVVRPRDPLPTERPAEAQPGLFRVLRGVFGN